jgi:hypothetical protein
VTSVRERSALGDVTQDALFKKVGKGKGSREILSPTDNIYFFCKKMLKRSIFVNLLEAVSEQAALLKTEHFYFALTNETHGVDYAQPNMLNK